MESATKRSYLGIASCLLFAIATSALAVVMAMNWNAQHKLAGFEMIVVGPFALLLYCSGIGFAVAGLRNPAENPLSRAGLAMNSLAPVLLLLLRMIHVAAVG